MLQGEREMARVQQDARPVPRWTALRRRRAACRRSKLPSISTPTASCNVSAKDLGTGKEQKITITASTNLSEEEIKKAVDEAEKYADEDKKRKEEVEACQPGGSA